MTYKMNVIITNESGQEYHKALRGRTVNSVKKKISSAIHSAFPGKDYSGHVSAVVERNGVYVDSDEGFFSIVNNDIVFEL